VPYEINSASEPSTNETRRSQLGGLESLLCHIVTVDTESE
jgi:hypothetical protein